ncbi:MAG TPA: PAS domain-containing protein, partial [Paracoccaceae bacterium]|nr:PAS domain-containing protein [Paracoccaceae bacterium]
MIRWGLRLRVFLFFALIVVLGAAAFGLGLQLVASRQPGLEAASLVPALLVGAIGLAAITLWVWFQFDLNVARPILGLARAIETRAHADVAAPVETAEARYLGPLGAALRAVAAKLAEARRGRAEAMAAAAAAETAQKARLEAVIQRVEEAVIVCSMSHHVLLANDRAAALLGRTGAFGLGRPLDRILTPAPLNHALDRLSQGPAGRGTLAVCTTADGATLLQCRIAPIPGQGRREPGGYVLTVADVTEEIEAHAERDRLLSETLETSRRSAANLTALLDALAGDPAMEAAARAHFESCLRDEARALSEATRRLAARAEAAIARHWPMAEVPAWDILNSAAASMPGISMVITEEIAVTCDSLTLVNLLRDLAGRLGEGRDLVLSATPREP